MTVNERRAEIMRIMIARRSATMSQLALELGVSWRTVNRDICCLTADYPLETRKGGGGCVLLPDWYHPHRHIFSREQQETLLQLMDGASEYQRQILSQMLAEYGSPHYRQTLKERRK